jgi:hypothetical protein
MLFNIVAGKEKAPPRDLAKAKIPGDRFRILFDSSQAAG